MTRILRRPGEVYALECIPSAEVPTQGGTTLARLHALVRADLRTHGHHPDAWSVRENIEWTIGDRHAVEIIATQEETP